MLMELPDGPDLLIRSRRILFPSEAGLLSGEVAVRGGRISAIAKKGPLPFEERKGLDLVDISDSILCPAFIDSHMHLYQWSLSRSAVDLSKARSWVEIMEMLSKVKDGSEDNHLYSMSGILMGVDYDDSNFLGNPPPSLRTLDSAFGGTPVLLRRVCGHVLHMNSAAAEAMNIPTDHIKDGPLRDDEAMEVSWKVPFDGEAARRALLEGIRGLWSLGIAGGVEIIPETVLERMLDSFNGSGGGLRLSICVSGRKGRSTRGVAKGIEDWEDLREHGERSGAMVEPVLLFEKHFMDGSIGSRTACFSKEFSGSYPANPLLETKGSLQDKVQRGSEDGLIPMVHAIGDRAVSAAIEWLGLTGGPFRIEHSEGLTSDHLKALEGGPGVLSLQPNFQRVWGNSQGLYERRLGEAYLRLNPFMSLYRSKARWCFGSDMMPPGPLFGIGGAMLHQNGKERLGPVEALRGYSEMSSRFSIPGPQGLGTINIGAPADLVMIRPDMKGVTALFIDGKRRF